MVHKRYFNLVFLAIMVITMGSVISFITTVLNFGFTADFFFLWGRAFIGSATVAAPTAFFVGPLAQKLAMAIASKN